MSPPGLQPRALGTQAEHVAELALGGSADRAAVGAGAARRRWGQAGAQVKRDRLAWADGAGEDVEPTRRERRIGRRGAVQLDLDRRHRLAAAEAVRPRVRLEAVALAPQLPAPQRDVER